MTLSDTPNGAVDLTVGQLRQLLSLAERAHDGSVQVEPVEHSDLRWLRVSVLLTDMGKDHGPLHTFYLSPKGSLKRPQDV